jgi:hypothetical protein
MPNRVFLDEVTVLHLIQVKVIRLIGRETLQQDFQLRKFYVKGSRVIQSQTKAALKRVKGSLPALEMYRNPDICSAPGYKWHAQFFVQWISQ